MPSMETLIDSTIVSSIAPTRSGKKHANGPLPARVRKGVRKGEGGRSQT